MRRVMTIYGTRPEAIKMAPLIAELQAQAGLEPVVAVTGQHREMLDQVNELFGIVPNHDLDLMTHGADLAHIAATALTNVNDLLASERPDVVVVQGDTSSAFAAGLAAFYHQIPLVHLEAGLRTRNIYSPFPEEVNRRLTAPLCALNLAPTATARANLEVEGITPDTITVIGNTVIDALLRTVGVPVTFTDPDLGRLVASGESFILVTSHRRESWGERMADAMLGLRDVSVKHPELQIVLPMHRNPVVRKVIEATLLDQPNVRLSEPLSYHEFAHALRACRLVVTDSGGVQEEAPSLGKPVLVMRDTTERPEAVMAGTVKLVGTDRDLVRDETLTLLEDPVAYARMANAVNPYGDGRAAPRGVAAIAELVGVGERLPEFDGA
jgi:UDP-N-acetylglucosamine 2-epimerase (non-hydrolysing)